VLGANLQYRDGKIWWDNGSEAIIPEELKVCARGIVQGSFERWTAIYEEIEQEFGYNIVRELQEREKVASASFQLSLDTASSTTRAGSSEDSNTTKVSKTKSTWSKMDLWWGVQPERLNADEYRIVTSADENSLCIIFKNKISTRSAPILACNIPNAAVELQSSEDLLHWVNSLAYDAFVSIAMKHPSRDTMAIINDMGASFPLPAEDALMPAGFFVCTGHRGCRYSTDWNCIMDVDLAVVYETVRVPADLMAQAVLNIF